jgi:hypothetical protein
MHDWRPSMGDLSAPLSNAISPASVLNCSLATAAHSCMRPSGRCWESSVLLSLMLQTHKAAHNHIFSRDRCLRYHLLTVASRLPRSSIVMILLGLSATPSWIDVWACPVYYAVRTYVLRTETRAGSIPGFPHAPTTPRLCVPRTKQCLQYLQYGNGRLSGALVQEEGGCVRGGWVEVGRSAVAGQNTSRAGKTLSRSTEHDKCP